MACISFSNAPAATPIIWKKETKKIISEIKNTVVLKIKIAVK